MTREPDEATLRERALKRLKEKRDFATHVVAYIAVNAVLVAVWATTESGGFFWPVFPILGWGIAVVLQGWTLYRGEPSEEQIRREMQRLG